MNFVGWLTSLPTGQTHIFHWINHLKSYTNTRAPNSARNQDPNLIDRLVSFERKITRVHLDETIIMTGHPNRVDPNKCRPLIMSFQEFYGLGAQLRPSALATIPEESYRPAAVR